MSNASPTRTRRSRVTANDKESPENYVRRLAQQHCGGAMRALAAVARDLNAPAAARITAATSLVAWALGTSVDGAGSAPEASGGKRAAPEQVVRLAWMESNNRTRNQPKKPKGEAEKAGTGKEAGDKRGR
jgi:hypothetical protein